MHNGAKRVSLPAPHRVITFDASRTNQRSLEYDKAKPPLRTSECLPQKLIARRIAASHAVESDDGRTGEIVAKASVARALELDPQLAAGHTAVGYTRLHFDWNAVARAENSTKRSR